MLKTLDWCGFAREMSSDVLYKLWYNFKFDWALGLAPGPDCRGLYKLWHNIGLSNLLLAPVVEVYIN